MASRRPREFFYQDLVQHSSRQKTSGSDDSLGLVWRVADDPDADLTSEDDDSDCSVSGQKRSERKQTTRVPDGHAQVAWLSSLCQKRKKGSKESVSSLMEKAEDLRLVDRDVAAGYVVASASDPLGQTALVTGVSRFLDVLLSDGRRLSRVPLSAVSPVIPYHEGQIVIHGEFAGRLEEMVEQVTVRLNSGETVSYSSPEASEIVVPANRAEYMFQEAGSCLYYPGQQVCVFPAGGKVHNTDSKISKGVVLDVQVTHFHVDWLTNIGDSARPLDMAENPVARAACTCLSEDSQQAALWHLGTRGIWMGDDSELMALDSSKSEGENLDVRQSGGDTEETSDEKAAQSIPIQKEGALAENAELAPEQGSWATRIAHKVLGKSGGLGKRKLKRKPRRINRSKQEPEVPKTALVTRTYTYADLAWQDGTIEQGVPTIWLAQRSHLDDHDFWPEEFVSLVHDELQPQASRPALDKVGVIRACDPKSRTATVAWMKRGSDNLLIPLQPDCPTEMLPVYKLEPHRDYNYLIGDLVSLTASKSSEANATASLGIVAGGKNGELQLHLLTKEEVYATPDRVAAVISGLDDDGNSEFEDDLDEGSWTTVSSESGDSQQSDTEGSSKDTATVRQDSSSYQEDSLIWDDEEVKQAECGEAHQAYEETSISDLQWSSSGPAEAMSSDDTLKKSNATDIPLPTSTGGSGCASSTLGSSPEAALGVTYGAFESSQLKRMIKPEGEQQETSGRDGVWSAAQRLVKSVIGGWPEAEAPAGTSTAGLERNEYQPAQPESPGSRFPRFAVLEDAPLDHAFSHKAAVVGKKFQKPVLREWKLLEASLPDTIWVRAYESRMDLLRAAILGAADTPYAGHLFIFDMQLPPDYPSSPPQVLYRAWGLRVNPNLYENGKVCLSLLGTWAGHKNEMWTSESTLLQVMVSIQGLILVSKPYFNEAGFDKQSGSAEGEHNAVLYNEQAFLLTIRSSMHLLANTPKGFEDLVKDNYKQRREALINASESLLKDPPTAKTALGSGPPSPAGTASEAAKVSAGFRLMLSELLPRFKAVLEKL